MDSTCKNGLETVLLTLFPSILMCPTQIWPTLFLLTTTNKIGYRFLHFHFATPESDRAELIFTFFANSIASAQCFTTLNYTLHLWNIFSFSFYWLHFDLSCSVVLVVVHGSLVFLPFAMSIKPCMASISSALNFSNEILIC